MDISEKFREWQYTAKDIKLEMDKKAKSGKKAVITWGKKTLGKW